MASKRSASPPSKVARTEGSGSWVHGPYGHETILVHGGQNPDPTTGAILAPIIASTTYVQESIDQYLGKGYSYTRSRNPTVDALEKKIAKAEAGYGCAAFSTGMAATTTVISAFMSQGDHAIITNCSYGGTNRLCRKFFTRFGMEFTFVDMTKLEEVKAAVKPNTKLILSETPTNPTLALTDLVALSEFAKSKKILHACDSTFATPVITRPIELGVDIVIQSTTKYYDGHNISVGGAVICATKELDDEVHFWQNVHGNIMSPWVAFLQLQTAKTMGLRIEKQSHTAAKIAAFLEKHPKVDKVVYPGLPSHPQHELAKRQHLNNLHGGMLAFEVKGGTASGRKLMDTVQRPWSLCENLGATESIITCPAVMTHANMEKEDRLKVGITDGFVRVSCGIEDADDLIRALAKALDAL